MVPEFTKAATILTVIPATSCSAERSFSGLRRLKTYLRSTMGEKRLANIALINIEREYANRVIKEDMERIIDIFSKPKVAMPISFNWYDKQRSVKDYMREETFRLLLSGHLGYFL